MATRILVVNLHSARNAGDAALLLAALQQLRQHLPGCRLTLLMNDPGSYAGEEPVLGSFAAWLKDTPAQGEPRWRWWRWPWLGVAAAAALLSRRGAGAARRLAWVLPASLRAVWQAYLEADAVVSCPGGFLYTEGGVGLPLLLSIFTMALAWLAGKPLYIFPQSIGPLTRAWERRLVRWLLRRARLVMVREPISLDLVRALGVAADRCHLLPDMAFTFRGAARVDAEAWLAAQSGARLSGRPRLGITAINWGAQNQAFQQQARYEAALAAAARFFVEAYGGEVVLFPQVCGPAESDDDRVPARRIAAQRAEWAGRLTVIEQPVPPQLLKAAYGLMDVFIGTRLHSNLFALSGGVPVIAIGYQSKTLGVMQMLGLEAWVLDIQQVDGSALTERLEQLWQRLAEMRAYLAQQVPEFTRQAEQAGALVAADLERQR